MAASFLTHLQRLQADSIQIMPEVAAESSKPVMLHLARKAFYPSSPPLPLLHVDTTWKFKVMYELREQAARDAGMDLLVRQNSRADRERGECRDAALFYQKPLDTRRRRENANPGALEAVLRRHERDVDDRGATAGRSQSGMVQAQ